jgi:hypothetical protein
MDIQVRTDYHVNGEQALIEFVQDEVAAGLDPFSDRITSVQVHLSEESGAHKGPHDLRCMVEVRPTGHEPVAVRNRAATKDDAVRGAVDQMYGVLTRLFGRLDQRHPGAETIRGRG